MGKLTISMAIFNSKPLVIARGYQENPMKDGRVTRKYQEIPGGMEQLSMVYRGQLFFLANQLQLRSCHDAVQN